MGMKENDMLCITMRRGEYFTVNGDTVIMLDQFSGDRIRMAIHAPKEVTVLRGAVLERNGAPPPACVAELSTGKSPNTGRTPSFAGTTSASGLSAGWSSWQNVWKKMEQ